MSDPVVQDPEEEAIDLLDPEVYESLRQVPEMDFSAPDEVEDEAEGDPEPEPEATPVDPEPAQVSKSTLKYEGKSAEDITAGIDSLLETLTARRDAITQIADPEQRRQAAIALDREGKTALTQVAEAKRYMEGQAPTPATTDADALVIDPDDGKAYRKADLDAKPFAATAYMALVQEYREAHNYTAGEEIDESAERYLQNQAWRQGRAELAAQQAKSVKPVSDPLVEQLIQQQADSILRNEFSAVLAANAVDGVTVEDLIADFKNNNVPIRDFMGIDPARRAHTTRVMALEIANRNRLTAPAPTTEKRIKPDGITPPKEGGGSTRAVSGKAMSPAQATALEQIKASFPDLSDADHLDILRGK